mmetsp:Transcript_10513/g.27456  ORF Transcript_10513/g.27456 Transcript_10513/m.27456 type:complete len:89 (-) Transcript_10513:80-346(-)
METNTQRTAHGGGWKTGTELTNTPCTAQAFARAMKHCCKTESAKHLHFKSHSRKHSVSYTDYPVFLFFFSTVCPPKVAKQQYCRPWKH